MAVKPTGARLRPITRADHPEVLALNHAFVELLAPLDQPRLEELLGWAERADVVELDGDFAGFVLVFAGGSAYDGENFAWFRTWADGRAFHYLDRIVLGPSTRRRGVGTAVYDEVEAACGSGLLCLEVNLDPPNEPSLAFHRARGFEQVGTRESGGHLVSLMAKRSRG